MSDQLDIVRRRVLRERQARREAESILEIKSRQLYVANEELQKMAKDLNEQVERMGAILDNAAEGIITFDGDCKIETCNRAAERIFGYSTGELIEKQFSSLFKDFADDSCLAVLGSESQYAQAACEYLGVRKDGSEFMLEMALSAVLGLDERCVVAIIRDRTQQKQLERQLALAQKMESVGQMAAGIAHEINTPIQYVGDNVQFLSDAFQDIDALLNLQEQLVESIENAQPTDSLVTEFKSLRESADLEFLREEVPQAIEQSKVGADRVSTIVRAMKEFSHPGVAEKVAVDINQSLDSTLTVSKNEWKYVSNIQSEFDPSLPSIMGYPGDLNQAFLNIIVNGAHAIEKRQQDGDKREGVLTIKTSATDDWLIIEIGDNGCGIPQSDADKIFDPFYTTKPVGKGTGQGLSITHSVIVEKHHGQIEVKSAVGEGTTFTLRLPRKETAATS